MLSIQLRTIIVGSKHNNVQILTTSMLMHRLMYTSFSDSILNVLYKYQIKAMLSYVTMSI